MDWGQSARDSARTALELPLACTGSGCATLLLEQRARTSGFCVRCDGFHLLGETRMGALPRNRLAADSGIRLAARRVALRPSPKVAEPSFVVRTWFRCKEDCNGGGGVEEHECVGGGGEGVQLLFHCDHYFIDRVAINMDARTGRQ